MSDHEKVDGLRPEDAGPAGNRKPGDAGGRLGKRCGTGFDRKICHWWEERSLPQKILIGVGFGVVAIGFAFLFGLFVMILWNWLMPEIFGLKRISYWQAWGLFLLCSILFKGMGSGSSSNRSDRRRRRELRRYMDVEQKDAKKTHEGE